MNPQEPLSHLPPGYYQQPVPPNQVKKDVLKTLGWVFGILAGVLLILVISVMGYLTAKHNEKIDQLNALADRITPASDWVEDRRLPVSDGVFCFKLDGTCNTLHRNWKADSPVDVEAVASQLGVPMEQSRTDDCMRSTEDGGRFEVCAYESERVDPGKWFVSLRISEG